MPQICSLTVLGARGHWTIRVSSYRISQGKPISLSSQLLEVPEFFGSSPPPSAESSLALIFVISWISVDPGKSPHLRNLNLTKPFLPCRVLSKNQDQDILGTIIQPCHYDLCVHSYEWRGNNEWENETLISRPARKLTLPTTPLSTEEDSRWNHSSNSHPDLSLIRLWAGPYS